MTTKSKKVLNLKSVEAAKPRETRYEQADASLPGFYLSVMPSGHKSYCVRYRYQGTPRRLGLGSHPQITPQAARKAAQKALGCIALGEVKTRPEKRPLSGAPLPRPHR